MVALFFRVQKRFRALAIYNTKKIRKPRWSKHIKIIKSFNKGLQKKLRSLKRLKRLKFTNNSENNGN